MTEEGIRFPGRQVKEAPPASFPKQFKEVTQKLKSIEAELLGAQAKVVMLTNTIDAMKVATKLIFPELMSRCPTCSCQMLRIDWNTKVYLLTCGNVGCRKMGIPIKNIRREYFELLGIIKHEEK